MSRKYERCHSGISLSSALNDEWSVLSASVCSHLCLLYAAGVPAGCSRRVRTTGQLICSAVCRLRARLYTPRKTRGQSAPHNFDQFRKTWSLDIYHTLLESLHWSDHLFLCSYNSVGLLANDKKRIQLSGFNPIMCFETKILRFIHGLNMTSQSIHSSIFYLLWAVVDSDLSKLLIIPQQLSCSLLLMKFQHLKSNSKEGYLFCVPF